MDAALPVGHMSEPRTFQIFLSSPGDVQSERNRAQTVVDRLNGEHPGPPVFALTRWEQSYYSATGTFQNQIPQPGDSDLVVFIFWKRLGTALPPEFNRADGTSRTGTEYEFEQARDAREHSPTRLPDILVYRKTAKVQFDEETVDDERAQKRALEQFWERWFRSDSGHYIAGFQSILDTRDFERQFERNLRAWLARQRAAQISWDVARQGSPYQGLIPYEEQHASLFFGRDADIARARAVFIEAAIGRESGRRGTPFMLVLGASGCGKSSFLRAGLVPRMRSSGVPAFLEDTSDEISAFCTLVISPRELGDDLCLGLSNALYGLGAGIAAPGVGLHQLADGDYQTADAFAALAWSSPESAVAPILRALERTAQSSMQSGDTDPSHHRLGLLIAIDQFEELFGLPESSRRVFIRLLGAFASSGLIWITGSMRNDFYDRLRQDADLSALSERGRIFDLAAPGLADYRDIICMPARAAGLRFEVSEHRDLAAELEAEAAGEGALPMVAFMLEQLFLERRGDLMLLSTYDRLGGAAGALAQRGDQVLTQLPSEVQAAFPRLVRRLVRKSLKDPAPTAVSAPLHLFIADSAERQLVDALAQARLIRTFNTLAGDNAMPTASVRWSHEALLIRWPRLRDSVEADRRDYETLDRISSAYSLYQLTPAAQQAERLPVDLALAEAGSLVDRWGTDVDERLREFVHLGRVRATARRRRRRRLVSATIAALSVFAVIATVAGLLAQKQRNRALEEQASADRTTRFMVSLFALADPSESRGNAVTVREVLDRGAAEVNQSLAGDPRIRADLLTAMGQAYSGLGLYDSAIKLLGQARTDESVVKMPAESRVRTLVALGVTQYQAADYEAAEKILREGVRLAREKLAITDVLRSEALCSLADVLAQLQGYAEAEALSREALAVDRNRGPGQASVLARTLDSLGNILYSSGNLVDAETAMREALTLHRQASGLRHPLTAQAFANLAAVLYQLGRYEEAARLYEQAMPIYRIVYGAEHPEVATMLNNLGRAALMAGNVAEAEPVLRQALAMNERLSGATHDVLVPTLNSIAMIDEYLSRLTLAKSEINRAERIARLPNHGALLDQVLLNAADLDLESGDLDSAEKALAEARGLLDATWPLTVHPSERWRFAVWDSVNAVLLARRGDVPGARSLLVNSLSVISERWGPKAFHTQLVRRRIERIERVPTNQTHSVQRAI